jgi:integrase
LTKHDAHGTRRAALRRLPCTSAARTPSRPRKRQARDSRDAGSAYRAELGQIGWYSAGDEYVVTDALGLPVHPEWYSDEFARLLKRASLRKFRLHDSRHTTLSLMEKAGVPISIISKWTGHYDAAAFTMRTYVHASNDDLKAGTETLAKMQKIA